ncbi:MAG: hypothetical protein LBK47_03705 [Prevotellaceae bacterium]|nr:hypothetical protein [Prevotellaceae bacterium]
MRGKRGSSAPLRGACPERSRGGRNDGTAVREKRVPPLRCAPVGMTGGVGGKRGSSAPLRSGRNDGTAVREKRMFCGGIAAAKHPLLQKTASFRPSPRGTSGRVEESEPRVATHDVRRPNCES